MSDAQNDSDIPSTTEASETSAVSASSSSAAASSSSAASSSPASSSSAASAATSSSAAPQPRTRAVPLEHGPLTLKEASILVIKQYGYAFNNIIYQLEPVLRDGSIVRFCLPGNNMELAQGTIRFGTEPIFDKDHNAAVPVAVYNLSYPRSPTSVVVRPQQ